MKESASSFCFALRCKGLKTCARGCVGNGVGGAHRSLDGPLVHEVEVDQRRLPAGPPAQDVVELGRRGHLGVRGWAQGTRWGG